MPDKYNWSRPEYLQRHLKDFYAIHKRFMGKWKPTRDDIVWMSETAMNTGPMWNTLGPSLLTIRAMASEEQHRRWLHGLITMRYIVTYAQTELGHGRSVSIPPSCPAPPTPLLMLFPSPSAPAAMFVP